ncbi:MAG TPA: amidohydrolase family protein [Candidatus Thermoplasmatota archaeon]|nr:amidohydrolase family protein [Candidatus Thermoplasmatota archaeon]
MSRVFDAHVHLPTKDFLVDAGGPMVEHGLQYFGTKNPFRTIEEMAKEFHAAGVTKAVLLAWDAETATKRKPITNDHVANIAKEHADLFLGVACVDPHKGQKAVDELDRAVRKLGMKGLKLHPQIQAFHPEDAKFRPLWKKVNELKLPTIVHTGTSGLGAGAPGGDGIHLDYSRPIHLDGVAADFPDIPFLCAHAGWPWHEELLAMALHKSNVFIDISGWLPKYLPESVLRYANSRLQDKFVFGSDYPFFDLGRCLASIREVAWKDGVLDKILWGNAARVFHL